MPIVKDPWILLNQAARDYERGRKTLAQFGRVVNQVTELRGAGFVEVVADGDITGTVRLALDAWSAYQLEQQGADALSELEAAGRDLAEQYGGKPLSDVLKVEDKGETKVRFVSEEEGQVLRRRDELLAQTKSTLYNRSDARADRDVPYYAWTKMALVRVILDREFDPALVHQMLG